MKKMLLFCCLFFWSCQNPPTESKPGTWQVVREPSEDVYYSSLHFADRNNGWAVGDSGTILHTGDSGNTWEYQPSGTKNNLRDVHFIDRQTGWAAGSNNTIIHTANGGLSWQLLAISGDSTRLFTSIYFTDELTGWTVHNSGEILNTQDGGATWEVQASWEKGGTALLSFVNDQIGYAKPGRDTLLVKTTDGGQHWLPISTQRFWWETDLFFIDEQHGWVSNTKAPSSLWENYANVFCTKDGGYTWVCQDTLPERDLSAICFINKQVGWVASSNKIYQTTDGGNTWTCQFNPEDVFLGFQDIFFVDDTYGWALGLWGGILKYVVP